MLYTGSFVPLQALELLIEAAPRVLEREPRARFLIVGGKPDQIAHYRAQVDATGRADRIRLVETRPQAEMPAFMAACEALVSPRVRGINPPGKLFSYLNSGKPVVACDTLVHNQILDATCSILVPPSAEGWPTGSCRRWIPQSPRASPPAPRRSCRRSTARRRASAPIAS